MRLALAWLALAGCAGASPASAPARQEAPADAGVESIEAEYDRLAAACGEAYRAAQIATFERTAGAHPGSPSPATPEEVLRAFEPGFRSLAARGEGRARLWMLRRGGADRATSEERLARRVEAYALVAAHADASWMEGFGSAAWDLEEEDRLTRALIERSHAPLVQAHNLAELAERAYGATYQDDAPRDRIAQAVERAKPLYRELLARFPSGAGGIDAPSFRLGTPAKWRGKLFELEHLHVGSTAPSLDLRASDGRRLRLEDLRGRVVVVLAVQGGSEEESRRAAVEALRERSGAPLEIVLIGNQRERSPRAEGGALAAVPTPPVAHAASWWDVGILPGSLLLDAHGVIRHRALRGAALERAVLDLLAELERERGR